MRLATGSGAPEVVSRNLEQVIGARVRDSCKATGLTLTELARAADISTAMVSRIAGLGRQPLFPSFSSDGPPWRNVRERQ